MLYHKAIHNILNTEEHIDYYIQDGVFVWTDKKYTKPGDELIAAEIKRLEAEEEAKKYIKLRASEYPSIGDQLDSLFKAGIFPEEMAVQIQAVKDKYPKG